MYEAMVFWETASTGADQSAGVRDFAELWRVAEKVVYSRTLQTVTSARTRNRARVRPRRGPAAQGDVRVRHHRWWCGACRPGDRRWPSRRVPLVPHPDPRRWGQARMAGQGARSASAAGSAPIQERRCPPPLPHQRLTTRQQAAGHASGVDTAMVLRNGPAMRGNQGACFPCASESQRPEPGQVRTEHAHYRSRASSDRRTSLRGDAVGRRSPEGLPRKARVPLSAAALRSSSAQEWSLPPTSPR
jgi:hypothetical protein